MKLERLELRNFLSWQQGSLALDGARLVALTGANGAGKSSLLDAVSYALFDAARGRTDDLVRLGASDMAVTVEFEHAGGAYRVTRGRTTRSGGKSFLELAVRMYGTSGEWLPLTRDSIRETQTAIEELLGLDATSFGTAVLLAQGQADRFAAATPAERKRVLSQLLGLGIWEAAESRARDTARTIEASIAVEQGHVDRLKAAIAELASADDQLARAIGAWADAEQEMTEAGDARDAAEADLREATAAVAQVAQAEAEVRRIEAVLEDHKARWRRASSNREAAVSAAERAFATLARADEVAQAVAAMPGLVAEVERLERAQQLRTSTEAELAEAEARLREMEEAQAAAEREHEARRQRALDNLRTIQDHLKALEPVTCPKCAHRFPADPGGLEAQLAPAEAAVLGIGDPPEPPLELARARAKVTRARIRVSELGDASTERTKLVDARAALLEAGPVAALADSMEAARLGRDEAEAALAAVQEEMDAISRDRAAERERLVLAQERAAEAPGLRGLQQSAETALARARERLAEADRRRTAALEARTRAEGAMARRRDLEAEAREAEPGLESLALDRERMRRLVAAFGVDGIPARIIESALPELAGHVNELLGELRPGMALEIRAQRARKGGQGVIEALDLVVRDGAGERPLALFSGGERTSIHLALAVGLSRLVARRAGARIESLIVDEPDGLDLEARRAFGHALRVIASRGDLSRVVLVSHHADLAEAADVVYAITKGADGSVVELAA